MNEFEVTCKVEKGERNIAYGEDCYCYYTQPNYTERIVRCRDCKHFAEGKKSCWCENDRHDNSCFYPEVNHDGFCAWGERKDND